MVIVSIKVCLWLDVKENPPHFKDWSPLRNIKPNNGKVGDVLHFISFCLWCEFEGLGDFSWWQIEHPLHWCCCLAWVWEYWHAWYVTTNTSWQTIQTAQAYIDIWQLNYMYNHIHNNIKCHFNIYIYMLVEYYIWIHSSCYCNQHCY